MVFTLTTRTDNQYAGVWQGNWTAGENNGIGNCTIRINGLIAGTITYPVIGKVNINGISDNSGLSFSYGYNSGVYSVIGSYSTFVNGRLTGLLPWETFWTGGRIPRLWWNFFKTA